MGGGEYLICFLWVSVGVRECHGDLCILLILAVRLPKLALEATRVSLLGHVGGGEYLICCLWVSVGVRECHGDLRILSILAVRLPKLALKASRVLIRSRGRWGILNLLFVGVRGCS